VVSGPAPGGFRVGCRWIPGRLLVDSGSTPVVSGLTPGGFRVVSQWFPGRLRVDSGPAPGDFRVRSG
jgi:hypothetical protein